MPLHSAEDALNDELIRECLNRGVFTFADGSITYRLRETRTYEWTCEEWVRAETLAWLMLRRDYPAIRLRTEVQVPRRTPSDFADIVLYRDDRCTDPYIVVENKSSDATRAEARQAVEQLFGNANSLRVPFGLYYDGENSSYFDVLGHPPTERDANRLGDRNAVPRNYGETPEFSLIAGTTNDIQPSDALTIATRVRRAHFAIWAGGKRDPLDAFDEWSKLLFAKVIDERNTATGQPRRFQVGGRETSAAVANRVHQLFSAGTGDDPTIFPPDARIRLPDSKVAEVVRILQTISFTQTEVDSIGQAFEEFFGSVFRGQLGQYFTMRQLARFVVAFLDIREADYLLDPTCGSGGFLLEALLQTWHRVDHERQGQPIAVAERVKSDFAYHHVYGVEIHEVLARICKINLLLHHDGHTNIEGDRSCLDAEYTNPRLNNPNQRFTRIVGNPPFGDEVKESDADHLGTNHLSSFTVANGLTSVASEQIIVERCIQWLAPGGRMGLVLPDGLLNNQGDRSNCPQTRRFIASQGFVEAIVSLPDYAFRRAGAQNKTSILFFRKFTAAEKRSFDRAMTQLQRAAADGEEAREISIAAACEAAGLRYRVFMAEPNHIGYTTTGAPSGQNELYRPAAGGRLAQNQENTVLGEWQQFRSNADSYDGRRTPDCMALDFGELWRAHPSRRIDPKYHLFQREAAQPIPQGWVRERIGRLLRQRTVPLTQFSMDREYIVLTISQTGEIRRRVAGKGNTPAAWTGDYFSEVSGSDWFAAETSDLVFSSIDLWKGCIAVVPPEFDGGLVTKEFPIYTIVDERLTPAFLQTLLRSRYYQRAFRAITTGHSNRRRTQIADFEDLEIVFPPDPMEQERLIQDIVDARSGVATASANLHQHLLRFSDLIDGRGAEELPELPDDAETVD